MSGGGVKPLVWIQAIRDDPRVGKSMGFVLTCLASRMRRDGTGWTTQARLAADAVVDVKTVRRALDWAMAEGYLRRTRRGHRIKDGAAVGSEYELALPVTVDGVVDVLAPIHG